MKALGVQGQRVSPIGRANLDERGGGFDTEDGVPIRAIVYVALSHVVS